MRPRSEVGCVACKAFYGIKDGTVGVVPYTLDDVVATLNEIVPYDWKGLIEQRIYAVREKPPVEGIEAAGWKLAYAATKPDVQKASESVNKYMSERWSVGIVVGEHGVIQDVTPGSPADKAGIAPAMKLIAVNGRELTPERFGDAIARTKTRPGMDVLVEHGDLYLPLKVDARGGPRYPTLQRTAGADLLSAIFRPQGEIAPGRSRRVEHDREAVPVFDGPAQSSPDRVMRGALRQSIDVRAARPHIARGDRIGICAVDAVPRLRQAAHILIGQLAELCAIGGLGARRKARTNYRHDQRNVCSASFCARIRVATVGGCHTISFP